MSDSLIKHTRDKILKAADQRVDHTSAYLFQLLGYRQRVAQQILSSKNEDFDFGSYVADFENCNEKIKELLAL